MRADLYELPFDQFQRYQAVRAFADFLRQQGQKLKVLDVGGYPGLIVDFLPDDEVVVVDVQPHSASFYVQADGAKLPFADQSFDLVCSCDTLEHVPDADRAAFIAELARVTKDFVLMTAPFNDERTNLAEEILYEYVYKVLRTDFVTLREHRDNGLPDLEQTLSWFREAGLSVKAFPSGHLYHWLPMMVFKHHLLAHPETAALHRRVDYFYNLNFSETDAREPTYRQVVIGSKSNARQIERFSADRIKADDGAQAGAADFAKLEAMRLFTELLDVGLKREISELVRRFNDKTEGELAAAREEIAAKDSRIADLTSIIKAQNDSLDELHALVSKIRNLPPYKLYSKLFKRR